jgi:hypothetical protein
MLILIAKKKRRIDILYFLLFMVLKRYALLALRFHLNTGNSRNSLLE